MHRGAGCFACSTHARSAATRSSPAPICAAVAELAAADGSVGWCVSIANSIGLFAALSRPRRGPPGIWADPRATCAWGPPNDCHRHRRAGRLSGHRPLGFRQRLPPCELDGRARRRRRAGRLIAAQPLRPADDPHLAVPGREATLLDNWNPIGLRGTASESYAVKDLFVPEELTGTREDPTLRREPGPLYAFPQQTLYSVGIASVALGIARGMLDAFVDLAGRKTPRGIGRLADNAVIQAEIARNEARLGAAFAYLVDTVRDIYARGRRHRADRRARTRPRPARRQPCDHECRRCRRLDLQGRRGRRDLSRQPVRAPFSRHPHGLAADPVARRALRDLRPGPARQPTRNFPVASVARRARRAGRRSAQLRPRRLLDQENPSDAGPFRRFLYRPVFATPLPAASA